MLASRGAEIQWLYFDELTHFTEPVSRFHPQPRARAGSNEHRALCALRQQPRRAGAQLGEELFCGCDEHRGNHHHPRGAAGRRGQAAKADEYNASRRRCGTTRTCPNTYEVELMLKPPKLRDALLYGKWDAFDGQAFPEFIDDREHYEDRQWTHVIAPFSIPLWWPRVVSFDHGYTRPYSFGAWAIDEEGRVYRYKELYGCKEGEPNTGVCQTPEEIARALEAFMEPEYREGIHVSGIADPAIWRQKRGTSVEEQIRHVFSGVTFMQGRQHAAGGQDADSQPAAV